MSLHCCCKVCLIQKLSQRRLPRVVDDLSTSLNNRGKEKNQIPRGGRSPAPAFQWVARTVAFLGGIFNAFAQIGEPASWEAASSLAPKAGGRRIPIAEMLYSARFEMIQTVTDGREFIISGRSQYML
jgi:hypothetical protein